MRFLWVLALCAGVCAAQTNTIEGGNGSGSTQQGGAGSGASSVGGWRGQAVPAANFGFQCGQGKTTNCENPSPPPVIEWPSAPTGGLVRLHAAETYWPLLNPSSGTFTWTSLDEWLDTVAAHQPMAVAQQFMWVPCWDAPTCVGPADAPGGTNAPPSDLTASGSPTFNLFVTNFVQHCSPAGNCAANLIKYYQMWNEWDMASEWGGTLVQLYEMVAPAVAIIRANVPNAVILMPSSTPADANYACNFLAELNLDKIAGPGGGRLSDWVDFHLYLSATSTTTNTPEVQWGNYVSNGATGFLDLKNGAVLGACSPGPTKAVGWLGVPWVDSEINFSGSSGLGYACPTAQYTTADCEGQIVRVQLLFDSNGASGLWWYYWNQTIGGNPSYDPAYTQMMDELTGGAFTVPATFTTNGGIQTWTCPLVESGGKNALFVWTPSEGGTSYTVPHGYVDYVDVNGVSHPVSGGQSITIGVQPFLLET